MNRDKELAYKDTMDRITKSWTWERLTEQERQTFLKTMGNIVFKGGTIVGSYNHRWEVIHSLYWVFLDAIGYKPIGWREPETDLPQF